MSERRRRVTVPLPVLQPWSASPADPFGAAEEDRRRIVRAQRLSLAVLALGLGAITFGVAFLATGFGALPTGAEIALVAVGAATVVLADARLARLGALRRAGGSADGTGGADPLAWGWGAGEAGGAGGWGDSCGAGFFGGGGGDGGDGGGGGGC